MIRHILIIPVILFSATLVCSQPKGVNYHIGPKAALNVYKSRFNFKEDENTYEQKMKYGFQIGGAFDMKLKEMIHFYSELYYSHKGKKTIITQSSITNDAVYHFLELPVLVRFKFNAGKVSSGPLNWHLDVGPSISYWLGGKGNLSSDGPLYPFKVIFGYPPESGGAIDEMYITNANRWQWGLMAGVGMDYPVTKGQIVFIDFRVSFGGTNLGEYDSEVFMPILGFSDSMNVRFLEFSLGAAYVFEVDWNTLTRKGKSTVKKRKKS